MTANSQSPKPKCKCNTEDTGKKRKVQIQFLLHGDLQCSTLITQLFSIKPGYCTHGSFLPHVNKNKLSNTGGGKDRNKQADT